MGNGKLLYASEISTVVDCVLANEIRKVVYGEDVMPFTNCMDMMRGMYVIASGIKEALNSTKEEK